MDSVDHEGRAMTTARGRSPEWESSAPRRPAVHPHADGESLGGDDYADGTTDSAVKDPVHLALTTPLRHILHQGNLSV
ncbi:MAG: hypothetical protein JWL72_3391, partial [Ilumatobacteraceae bacterium]|nr:hypothetical protein [Ilumatobacteraceae bacterium]